MLIERFVKNLEGNWTLFEYKKEAEFLLISSIDFKLPLDEVYLNVFEV